MASAVILLPFYTSYLTTETFGAFSVLLAFSLLVQVIVTFSFDSSIYIHFHEYQNDAKKLSVFISSSFTLMFFLGILVSLGLIIVGDYILSLVLKETSISFYPYGLLAVLTGIFQAFLKVYNSFLQTKQKPILFLRSNLLAFSLIAGFTIAGLRMEPDSLFGPMGARLVSAAVCGTWAFIHVVKEFGFHFDYRLLQKSFSFNFYAFIYQIQQWIMNYFDRILLLFFLPLSEVGVYGFLISCLMVMEFLLNGLYNSIAPKVVALVYSQKLKSTTVELNRYYNGLTAVAMVLVAGIILTFPVIIEFFISKPGFQKIIPYLPYAILIYLLRPIRLYFGIPFGILKYTKPLPVIYTIVAGLKILILILLVKPLGLYGVIISSLISNVFEILILFYSGKKRIKYNFNVFKLMIAPASLMLLVAIVEPSVGRSFPLTVHSLYLLACIIVLGLAYKKEIILIDPLNMLRR